MEIYKSRAEENAALRVLEKDLAQTSNALSNLQTFFKFSVANRKDKFKRRNEKHRAAGKRQLSPERLTATLSVYFYASSFRGM